jgi:predicted porin
LTCIKSNLVKVAKYCLLDLGQTKLSFVVFGDLRMKKLLIATAALAMVAGTAQAQSSVTVYGIVDTSYGVSESTATTGVKTKTTSAGQDGQLAGSRLGFRGTEDLGGGNSAIFQIEIGLNTTEAGVNTVNSGGTNRNSFVGLQSNTMGTLKAGRMPTLNKMINDSTVFAGSSMPAGWVAQVNGATISNERQNNMVEYTTPTFSGLNASVQLVEDKTTVSNVAVDAKNKGMYLGLNYKAGALDLRYANKSMKNSGPDQTEAQATAAITGVVGVVNPNTSLFGTLPVETSTTVVSGSGKKETKVTQDSVLASYDFGVAKVVVTYNDTGTTIDGTAGKLKQSDTTIGVSVPRGNWMLMAQYGEGDSKPAAGTAKTDLEGFQLGAVYNLSKRTAVYGLYGEHETQVVGAATKLKADSFAVGVRHSF